MAGGKEFAARVPDDGFTRVPYFVYENAELYQEEQERIFRGPVWIPRLEIESPTPGTTSPTMSATHRSSWVRAEDGAVKAVVNRCAHKGSMICYQPSGACCRPDLSLSQTEFNDFDGKLKSVAFRHGVRGRAGCQPIRFWPNTRLVPLKVATIRGMIFALSSRR